MRSIISFLCLTFFVCIYLSSSENLNPQDRDKLPTVGISILVRNKARSLPYFFTCLYNLDYPKDRLYIWIWSDYNEDNSEYLVSYFAEQHKSQYAGIHVNTSSKGPFHEGDKISTVWSPARYRHVMKLREEALDFARKNWADYIFMLDADAFLTSRDALRRLVSKRKTIVAPMLATDGLYANFWCGMTTNYYYKRTDDYEKIRNREKIGCFSVPMVHTAVLIDMNKELSDFLTYDNTKLINYQGPVDDIIVFATSATVNEIDLFVCNDDDYGFLQIPLEDGEDPAVEEEQLLNTKLKALSRGIILNVDPIFQEHVKYRPPSTFGLDHMYMINLNRRFERRTLMQQSFKEIGMDVELIVAVDGKQLPIDDLPEHIKLMPEYEDPYNKRPMKTGEIGCFLSHYYVWTNMVARDYRSALILEDDVHFLPYFRGKLEQLMTELKEVDWDLVYIGRKILNDDESEESEEYVTPHLTRPGYSYWTLGYMLSQRGAHKLIDAEPLGKLLPVDEYLPIMFDQHPNELWKSYFRYRDLKAFSAAPLLIEPTHYTGNDGYISDTEDSAIVDPKVARQHRQRISSEF